MTPSKDIKREVLRPYPRSSRGKHGQETLRKGFTGLSDVLPVVKGVCEQRGPAAVVGEVVLGEGTLPLQDEPVAAPLLRHRLQEGRKEG